MKYLLPLVAILLVGAGCNPAPVTPAMNTSSTVNNIVPATTSTKTTTNTPEIDVQNFGNLAYMPVVVKQPTIPNPEYDMDWQGWWKVGQDTPERSVFVLIEGSDHYFLAINQDRSVEAEGHWEFTAGGKLIIETPTRVYTTFDRWVFVDGTTSYVLRGRTWEKWEKVADPMLPDVTPVKAETQLTARWMSQTEAGSSMELYEDGTYSNFNGEQRLEGGKWKFNNNELALTSIRGETIRFTDLWLTGKLLKMKSGDKAVVWKALK